MCDLRYVGGTSIIPNRIGGVMVSVLASSAMDRGFEPRSSQTKNYKIGRIIEVPPTYRKSQKNSPLGEIELTAKRSIHRSNKPIHHIIPATTTTQLCNIFTV
jgi:hypothetical protein